MDEKEKQEYLENYKKAKEKGIPFFPDTLFKDAIVALILFLVLIALAFFVGAPLEARADPADSSYTPRPEWYFLFLFQLLKYFPGELEFLGVVVIPTIAIVLLFVLPFIDTSPKRHFAHRRVIMVAVIMSVIGVITLSVLSVLEAPPPAEASQGGDQTAALYTDNCASCHGPSIKIPAESNLHEVIAEGKHEGMPAWSGDLTTDQIDALAGFILSPGGSYLFTLNCGDCHGAEELVATDPLELKNALIEGPGFAAHADADVPQFAEGLSKEEQTTLLNFLIAPDGKRLFTINCSTCHGRSIAFNGDENELRETISHGGLHLSMPAWQGSLELAEIDLLAEYVVDPNNVPEGESVFTQYCSSCHGQRIPAAENLEGAREAIASGGSHQTMPVWSEILTSAQLDALIIYTLEAASGTPLDVGQELFASYCAACHGDFGEGGPNPARPDDVIAPISTAEYLKTRDDFTLRSIIAQGQPNFGMSPFSSSFGGPLEEDKIDAIVAYLRSWEANPPVDLPPAAVVSPQVSLSSEDIYGQICAQCHGPEGLGATGPSLRDPEFQSKNSVQDIFETISNGHEATSMISWGELLNVEQIQGLSEFISQLDSGESTGETQPTPGVSSFTNDVMPIFQAKCIPCHGTMGGWDGTTYETVMTTGNNAPPVMPGDAVNSLLAQKILGTHEEGTIMPPGGKMTNGEIQLILDWIAAGAPDN
ncbi:MAG: c-type cytochrome [Anaerolineales bacterium]|nr:c-type cytochrome [Anaerolineales bacterium]